jgi:PAS domain S-box-containing protein
MQQNLTQSLSSEQELELLRERLREAEEMHRAISHGEVDAFVVGPGGNARVLLLANAYQRYRQVVERMAQGALTATPSGQILFANQRFADMLGMPIAQMYTAPLESYVAVGDRAAVSSFLMLSTRDSHLEVALSRRDGTRIPVRFSIVSFADGYATVLVTDLRPMQWPTIALDALDSIRNSLDKLNRALPGDSTAQGTLRDISEEINGLAGMIDEMVDVEAPGGKGNP